MLIKVSQILVVTFLFFSYSPWYEKALDLGMQPAEFAGIKRMLEKNGRFAQNTDYRVDLNKWSSPELDRSNLIT